MEECKPLVAGATTMIFDHFAPRQKLEPRRMNNGILTAGAYTRPR